MPASSLPPDSIAIIGMSCRFPGADTPDAFWQNLADGVESIRTFSDAELRAAGIDDELLQHPTFVPAAGAIDDTESFDASFFGLSPREAEMMDPQQRIFLEEAWTALEHAGYDPNQYDGLIGAFAGVGWNTYLLSYAARAQTLGVEEILQFRIRNDKDFLTTLASYKLNLRGPSLAVQTACSTSLVAVHLACQNLLDYQCDTALAGGINLSFPTAQGYTALDGVFAPDGHCRAFDADAAGTVSGSGAGLLVLKRLDDALADGDTIHAVVRGTALNNDGAQKAGYTAPSVDGQAEVVALAQAVAGVTPDTISYVEAHGTGTPVGDPIEVEALTQVFREHTDATQFCALGSVKTNIGHLDAAAGVASLIKVILSMQNGQLPPSLHYQTPNPRIPFADTPFYVNDQLRDWTPPHGGPRRAGISAFGVGGTNAHVILEEAPTRDVSTPSASDAVPPRRAYPVVVSARTETALDAATDRLADFLNAHPDTPLADVAFTQQRGRRRFDHRRVVAGTDAAAMAQALRERTPSRVFTTATSEDRRPVAFLFPGLGEQYPGVARDLYDREPVFRAAVDTCADLLQPHLDRDVRTILFPDTADAASDETSEGIDLRAMLGRGRGDDTDAPDDDPIYQTRYAQPIVFVLEYALAQLWMKAGVTPYAMIGHSLGEYVAACLAGVLSLEDALAVVAQRAALIDAMPGGSMAAISLPENVLRNRLPEGVSVGAVNTPEQCVASGPSDAVGAVVDACAADGVVVRRLQTTHAFHSSMMDAVADDLMALFASVTLHPPTIPYVSNVTGTWITEAQATDPAYWARHLCEAVRFADGVATLTTEASPLLLEVGAGQTLGAWALQHPATSQNHGLDRPVALKTLRSRYERGADDDHHAQTLGRLWLHGADVDWDAVHASASASTPSPRRIPLPTYPFERVRYALHDALADEPASAPKSAPRDASTEIATASETQDVDRRDVGDWFSVPSWRLSVHPASSSDLARNADGRERCWLVLAPDAPHPLVDAVLGRLRDAGVAPVVVRPGDAFDVEADDAYRMRRDASDVDALLRRLRVQGRFPTHVVHGWALTGESASDADAVDALLDGGFYSVLHLAQALGTASTDGTSTGDDRVQVTVLADDVHAVTGSEVLEPAKAALVGPSRVMRQEMDAVASRVIDVARGPHPEWYVDRLAESVLHDALGSADDASTVAYRRSGRWTPTFEPVAVEAAQASETEAIRDGGVYWITGGLGGIGLTLAQRFAAQAQVHLVLTSRRTLPARDAWDAWIAAHPNDAIADVLRAIQAIEATGSTVTLTPADVTDADAVQAAVDAITERFGTVTGVVHAAGVMPGGLMQVKTRDGAADVLAPKVQGTLHLAAALRDASQMTDLDFFVCCSSLHALAGGVGSVDHTAANAVLDAFAHHEALATGARVLSVNWGGWADVGQAANAAFADRLREVMDEPSATTETEPSADLPPVLAPPVASEAIPADAIPVDHPLLDARRIGDRGETFFVRLQTDAATSDASDANWIVDDHRIGDRGVVPGTAMLEMVRAAIDTRAGDHPVRIDTVHFLAPLVVAPTSTVIALHLDYETDAVFGPGTRARFRITTGDAASSCTEHARGRVEVVDANRPAAIDLDAVAALCSVMDVPFDDLVQQQSLDADAALHLGPRWQRLVERVQAGDGELLGALRLPDAFEADVDAFELHPSLFDTATGLVRLGGDGTYLPMAYERLTIHAPIPARCFSHVRFHPNDADSGVMTADCTVVDASGRVCVEVEGYSVRRVDDADAISPDVGASEAVAPEEVVAGDGAPAHAAATPPAAPALSGAASADALFDAVAIAPDDGADALMRLLASGIGPQVAISPEPVADFVARADAFTTTRIAEQIAAATGDGSPAGAHGRPALATPFVEPRSDLERDLAQLWQTILGVDGVGVHDSFFELGGDSLLGTQLITQIGTTYGVDVPLRVLFETPTVEGIAVRIVERQAAVPGDDVDALLDAVENMTPEEIRAALDDE